MYENELEVEVQEKNYQGRKLRFCASINWHLVAVQYKLKKDEQEPKPEEEKIRVNADVSLEEEVGKVLKRGIQYKILVQAHGRSAW